MPNKSLNIFFRWEKDFSHCCPQDYPCSLLPVRSVLPASLTGDDVAGYCWGVRSAHGGEETCAGGISPERHVFPFLGKASIGDILNYEHKVWCKPTSLLRVHGDVIYLFSHKINHTEWRSSIPHIGVVGKNPPTGVDRQHESREARSLYPSAL
jgi:hypothetical protein